MSYDKIGEEAYFTVRKVFDFKCQMMYWANDSIRVLFSQPLLGKILDSRKTVHLESEFNIMDNPDLEDTDFITFDKSSAAMSQA